MNFAGTVRATFSPDIGIDLGTANTVVYSHDEGILVSEPSVVAYRTSDDAMIALGHAAKELDGRSPGRINVVRPLRGGTISDFRGAHALVKTLVDRALASRPRIAPRVIACIPGCATDIECKAVEEAIRAAGPRTTEFVPQAVAAAVGAGLDIMGSTPRMVIDIGGGTTEIAVLISGGVVAMHSIKVGGDTFVVPWDRGADWLRNVEAHPDVVVDDRVRVRRARAELVKGKTAEAVRLAFLERFVPEMLRGPLGAKGAPFGPGLPAVRLVSS